MTDKEKFMLEAIRLSESNMESGEGGPFGAVIVKDGEIVATGSNKVTSANDPTAHAEVMAIRNACKELGDFSLEGCDIYTSCEPCPMCLSAIYWARIKCIYYANTRKDAADIGFDDNLIYEEIPKQPEERLIPANPILREEALKVFNAWTAKLDKKHY